MHMPMTACSSLGMLSFYLSMLAKSQGELGHVA